MANTLRQSADLNPLYFAIPAELREWLERNHTTATELWIGFYKRSTGLPSITWPEAVDQLLCFGWIDGVRRSIDEVSYAIRVTPRRKESSWSAVNMKRARELKRLGLMHEAGLKAFSGLDRRRVNRYSVERERVQFTGAQERQFRANRKAWLFFKSQPAGYQKTTTWWVVSAKQAATRQKRLATLIADSAAGVRIAQMRRAR